MKEYSFDEIKEKIISDGLFENCPEIIYMKKMKPDKRNEYFSMIMELEETDHRIPMTKTFLYSQFIKKVNEDLAKKFLEVLVQDLHISRNPVRCFEGIVNGKQYWTPEIMTSLIDSITKFYWTNQSHRPLVLDLLADIDESLIDERTSLIINDFCSRYYQDNPKKFQKIIDKFGE